MRYLLSISIGPVQDFIAAARKTRDLWCGSELLCKLSREAARKLQDKGAELIFPPTEAVGDPNSPVANKLLVLVETDDPGTLAEQARQEAQTVLNESWNEITRKWGDLIDRVQLGAAQIEQFLEFYVAWWPCGNDQDYKNARTRVERLLAGRKALRDFQPAAGRAGIPKSSLDGGREAVIEACGQDQARLRKRARAGIKEGELLDAVSLIKRLGKNKRFVSVARVAADPVIRLLDKPALDKLRNICEELKNSDLVHRFESTDFPQYRAFPYDTQLFYNDLPTKEKESLKSEEIDAAERFRCELQSACKNLSLRDPYPYFAVLAADGDHMGAAINEITDSASHVEFSQKLGQFATNAAEIVRSAQGVTIYSGGDDVLAFLPMDTAIDCASRLREAFEPVAALAQEKGAKKRPTLSCGISIAHYGEHLQDLLKWAREAEKAAKKNDRNSLAVHLHTRTAGEESVPSVRKWDEIDQTTLADYWNLLVRLFAEDRIPDGAVYELRRLAREFGYEGADQEILAAEIKRILNRKRKEHGSKEIDKEDIDVLLTHAGKDAKQLARFVDELLIARRIAMGQPVKEVK